MSAAELKELRKKVKEYIDRADGHTVKMVQAMLEVDAERDRWKDLPDNVKADVEESLAQADRGEVITHEEMKKKYPQWFTKSSGRQKRQKATGIS